MNDRAAAARGLHRIGDLTIDERHREVRRGADVLPVADLSFDVLLYLIRQRGRVIGPAELINQVWSPSVVSEDTVKQRVKLLRQTLGDDAANPRYVHTIRGTGYCVTEEPSASHLPWWAAAAVTIVLLAVVAIVSVMSRGDDAATDQHRVVVLPLQLLNPNRDDRAFALGLAHRIRASIATFPGLEVISTRASHQAEEARWQSREIQSELGASHIVTGIVEPKGTSLLISVQLLDAASDTVIWTQDYNTGEEDLYAIQSSLAGHVSLLIMSTVDAAAARALMQPESTLEASIPFVRALGHWQTGDAWSLQQARHSLEASLTMDPEFWRAHALLAQVLDEARAVNWQCGKRRPDTGRRRAIMVFGRRMSGLVLTDDATSYGVQFSTRNGMLACPAWPWLSKT